MNRAKSIIVLSVMLFFICSAMTAFSQDVQGPAKVVDSKGQAKLMARRAAIEDGYRQMAEIVFGVRLEARTTVRDFVAERDEIRSRVNGVIRFARIVDTEYTPEGICKVRMELSVRSLQKALGRKFPFPSDMIRVVGTGALNPVAEPTPPPPPPMEEPYEWQELIISAMGTGLPPDDLKGTPRGRLMAERAAYLDALRLLGENIKGVYIDSKTQVRDFVTQSDEITSTFEGWLQGARKTMVRELSDGTVEVDVEMPLSGLHDVIMPRRALPD